jgi:hypothetical protein
MSAARRTREIHELATQRRHRGNLACRRNLTDSEGSNVIDIGWGDDLL